VETVFALRENVCATMATTVLTALTWALEESVTSATTTVFSSETDHACATTDTGVHLAPQVVHR
jgi:hypothetical protein